MAVQIGTLVMDGIIMGIKTHTLFKCHFVQEVTDFYSVRGMINVPKGSRENVSLTNSSFHQNITAGLIYFFKDFFSVPRHVTILGESYVNQTINGVGHVNVQVGGPLAGVQRRPVGNVHFGSQFGFQAIIGQITGQVEDAVPVGVFG